MHFFFGNFEAGEYIELPEEEARHGSVLRLRLGEQVGLSNGLGLIRYGEISAMDKKKITVKITTETSFPSPQPQIHLAVSTIKNTDRMEWLVEKITELGVAEITPLVCEHTEKPHFRTDRMEKIITSAFKQCGRAWRPVLHELTRFDSFLGKDFPGTKWIGIQSGTPIANLREQLLPEQILICIGPEGDFSDHELSLADHRGFKQISFGQVRLRTETAAMMSVMLWSLLDWR